MLLWGRGSLLRLMIYHYFVAFSHIYMQVNELLTPNMHNSVRKSQQLSAKVSTYKTQSSFWNDQYGLKKKKPEQSGELRLRTTARAHPGFKALWLSGWSDDSEVCRVTGFRSLHPQGRSQSFPTAVPVDLWAPGMHTVHIPTCRQNK